MNWSSLFRRNRRVRQDFTDYAALVATPGSLTTGVALPAAGILWVSTTSALVAATALVDIGARSLGAPIGAANARHKIGYFETGMTVELAATAVGTVSLYVEDPARVLHKIAET
jgi:hypothetical protein